MIKIIIATMIILLTGCNEKGHDHAEHEGHDHAEHEGHDHAEHEGHDHAEHEGEDHADHKAEGHDEHGKKGPNGGELLEVGKGIAEIEVIHNEETGDVKVFVFKEGGKEQLSLTTPPRINLTTDSGRKQIKTTPVGNAENSHAFSITDDLLKGHVELTVSLKINDKSYNVTIHHHH